jgi:hypothetical protein
MTNSRTNKLGTVVLTLFALPFALGGLAAMWQAIHMATSVNGNPQYWVVALFGLVFTGIGCGLIYVAFYGNTLLQRKQRLQIEHPSEPWLWQADWAQGRVKSKTRANTIGAWLFAIFWNVVSMPVAFLTFSQIAKQKSAVALIVLVFPILGVYLLIRAIRQSIALFEFGETWFEMSSVPAVIGRELKGQIQARFPHSPEHGIHLRLSCVHRVTSNSGNSSTTSERILWREESDLSASQIYPGPTGTTIPVLFHIPVDAQPTEKINFRDEFVWTLEASADVPGVDYHDIFEVPVFRTQQTPTQSEAEKFAPLQPPPVTRPNHITIQVRQTLNGTEFYFPAARNMSFAASLTVFLLLFSAITFFIIHRTPFIFPLAFGFFSLLLFYITLKMWMETTRVVISGSDMTVQQGWLGGGKTTRIPIREVTSVTDRITAQQGGTSGSCYYDIELTQRNGKKITLGHTIRDKQETEWLVAEIIRLLSLQPKTMSAGTF